jgi:hypothetical protein
VSEKRMLGRIFGPKRWRRIHNEELQEVYALVLGRSMQGEGKMPLGRPRRRWEVNIKMDFGETVYEFLDWIHLPQDMDQWQVLVNKLI